MYLYVSHMHVCFACISLYMYFHLHKHTMCKYAYLYSLVWGKQIYRQIHVAWRKKIPYPSIPAINHEKYHHLISAVCAVLTLPGGRFEICLHKRAITWLSSGSTFLTPTPIKQQYTYVASPLSKFSACKERRNWSIRFGRHNWRFWHP